MECVSRWEYKLESSLSIVPIEPLIKTQSVQASAEHKKLNKNIIWDSIFKCVLDKQLIENRPQLCLPQETSDSDPAGCQSKLEIPICLELIFKMIVIRNQNVQHHSVSYHPRLDQCKWQAIYSAICFTPSNHTVRLQEPQYHSLVDVKGVCQDQPHPTTSTLHTSKASYFSAGVKGKDVIWNGKIQHHPCSYHPRHDQCILPAICSAINLTPP